MLAEGAAPVGRRTMALGILFPQQLIGLQSRTLFAIMNAAPRMAPKRSRSPGSMFTFAWNTHG
jgi:hypothetical protein